LVYRTTKVACDDGEACARPLPNHLVKTMLWVATVLVVVAFSWPFIAPIILRS